MPNGGAIYNYNTTLTINNSTLSNSTSTSGGAIYNDGGPGKATLTINNSTLAFNTASTRGGAVYNYGANSGNATLTISNSTLTDNISNILAGAIYNDGAAGNATLTVIKSTLAFNRSSGSGGAIVTDGDSSGFARLAVSTSTLANNSVTTAAGTGGAIYTTGTTSIQIDNSTLAFNNAVQGGAYFENSFGATTDINNSIIANNTAPLNPDLYGQVNNSNYTLYSSNISASVTADLNSLYDTDPLLGTLGNYGGPTQTIPILFGSPAINGGYNVIGTTDQRGITYTANNIGSYATVSESACTVVSTTQDIINPIDNLISLREAITYAGTLGGSNKTITFDSNLTSSGDATITLNSNTANGYGPLVVNMAPNLTIQGPTLGNSITVSGGNATGIFYIQSRTTINNLSIRYGNEANLPFGGAIYNYFSILTINNSTLANNTGSYGGAVYNFGSFGSASLTINNTTIA